MQIEIEELDEIAEIFFWSKPKKDAIEYNIWFQMRKKFCQYLRKHVNDIVLVRFSILSMQGPLKKVCK
ncbi:MAG: hypothetical protein E6Q89_00655 [Bacteroidia bacterium]|nr:MAG: hypothetical protein E6Q89_00655 [Bacteroidia bacterium]